MNASIDPELWHRASPILDELLELPLERRESRLAELCRDNEDLRRLVERILDADQRAEGAPDAEGSVGSAPRTDRFLDLAARLLDEDGDGSATSDVATPAYELLQPPDRRIGPYRLKRIVGRGGMGVVYEAHDERLDRAVALKFLPAEVSANDAAKARFLREARAASRVDHPNICSIHDIGETEDGQLYIVMPLYQGMSLQEKLAAGRLEIDEAIDIVAQVARGLQRSHAAGITHRDIKPSNLLLTAHGEVKILDFGVAKVQAGTQLTKTGGQLGTPAYMSPEQIEGQPVDERTDIWSLGVLFYELLAGQRPFEGDSAAAVMRAVTDRDPMPLRAARPEVSPELAELVSSMLRRDPQRRCASASEVLTALGVSISTSPSISHSSIPTKTRLSRRPLIAFLSVVAASSLFALFQSRPWGAQPEQLIVVTPPAVQGLPEDADLAFALGEASLSAVTSLEGLSAVVDGSVGDELGASSATALALANAADEVVTTTARCDDFTCAVSLRRLSGATGEVLASQGPFDIPTGFDAAFQVATALELHVDQLFPGRDATTARRLSSVDPTDYAAFLALKQRVGAGQIWNREELQELLDLLDSSPGFFEAHVLALGAARGRGDYETAEELLGRADVQFPGDHRFVEPRFTLELERGEFSKAEEILERLEDERPGSYLALRSRARFLTLQGRDDEAVQALDQLAQVRPSWQNLWQLANLEVKLGNEASAREHLERLLEVSPGNPSGLAQLISLELQLGEPAEAERLILELQQERVSAWSLNNLGWARLLRSDFEGAALAYEEALALNADSPLDRFNLALARQLSGDESAARQLFAELVEDFERKGETSSLSAREKLWHAQALARLGQHQAAIELARRTLREDEADAQMLFQAALIYGVAGEHLSAVGYATEAISRGLQPRWFAVPWFEGLTSDDRYKVLLGSPTAEG